MRAPFVFALLLSFASVCHGQRAQENVAQSAEDAFGTSIGNESIGIYSNTDVRGFSPVAAGNVRIDGLYFDQEGALNRRAQSESDVRVGMTAQGYAFPAPTGIVDFTLRQPQFEPLASISAGVGPYNGGYGELDVQLPVGRGISVGGGVSFYDDRYFDGGGDHNVELALLARYRSPDRAIDGTAFCSRARWSDYRNSPVIDVSGSLLPPRFTRDRYFGQDWADIAAFNDNCGMFGDLALAGDWSIKLGLFRSRSIFERNYTNIIQTVQPDGSGDSIMIVDPPQSAQSWSGEMRLTKLISGERFRQEFDLALRARDKQATYGGSAFVDLGQVQIDRFSPRPQPQFQFSDTTSDHVKQPAVGVAYAGRWKNVGELSLGLQRVSYSETTAIGSGPESALREQLWLYNGSVALYATSRLSVFASYTRGLEDSGKAPDSAYNANALLPATITHQQELGFRWSVSPQLRWVTSWFQLQRPYATVDAGNIYRFLGAEVHRGLETSLTGKASDNLTVILGGLFANPLVSAADVSGLGARPVGQPTRKFEISADYALPSCHCSFDLNVAYIGRVPASLDDTLSVPSYTQVDIGTHYHLKIAGKPTLLRMQVTNVANAYGWQVISSRSFSYWPGRTVTAYLTTDF